jgi:hypothetical protein
MKLLRVQEMLEPESPLAVLEQVQVEELAQVVLGQWLVWHYQILYR